MADDLELSRSLMIPGCVPLRNVRFPSMFGSNLATGNNDLYTVPTGRTAIISLGRVYNQSAGNIGWYWQLSSGGTYYRLNSTTTTATLAANAVKPVFIVLAAGESISINTVTNNGLNAWGTVVEVPASTPIVRGSVLAPASGNNTVYTVPTGKTAMGLTPFSTAVANAADVLPVVYNSNGTAGSLNVIVHTVPSGGTPGATNLARPSTAVAANAVEQVPLVTPSMNTGDFLNVNWSGADAAPGISWVNIVEIGCRARTNGVRPCPDREQRGHGVW